MLAYQKDTKAYEACEGLVFGGKAEEIVTRLGKLDARKQMAAINTMNSIISATCLVYRSSDFANVILTEQGHKINSYGERAYGLSEKQLGVIARDIISRAGTKGI